VRYDFDATQSTLTIDASSSIHPIHTTADVTGWFEISRNDDGTVDGSEPVGGYVQLDLSAMRSGNPLIDRETERRLDVRRFPTVDGELVRLAATADPHRYDAVGRLTFHGQTHEVEGSVDLDWSDDRVVIDGTKTLDVTQFGVQPPSLLVVKVHKEITVRLRAVGVRVA
jgi:polyisoprenoid-binding protein YceI